MRIAVIPALALAAVALVSRIAAAQPSLTPPTDPEQPSMYPQPLQPGQAYPAPQPAETVAVKSESTATLLAIGATAGGFLLIGASANNRGDDNGWLALAGGALVLIGPSAGHIYAGETGHAVKATLLRSAGVLAMLAGAISLTTASVVDCEFESDCGSSNDSDRSRAKTLLAVGAAVYLGTTIYDLVDAGPAARRENRRHARAMMFVPSVMASNRGGSAPGVALVGRF